MLYQDRRGEVNYRFVIYGSAGAGIVLFCYGIWNEDDRFISSGMSCLANTVTYSFGRFNPYMPGRVLEWVATAGTAATLLNDFGLFTTNNFVRNLPYFSALGSLVNYLDIFKFAPQLLDEQNQNGVQEDLHLN